MSSSASYPEPLRPRSQLPPLSPEDELLLQHLIDPNRSPVTRYQMLTGNGLPESDQRLLKEVRRRAVLQALFGATLTGGVTAAVSQ